MDTQGAYLRREKAAEYLGVSPRTISDWQKRRVIPHIRMGAKCVLFRRCDLDKAVDRFTVQAIGSR